MRLILLSSILVGVALASDLPPAGDTYVVAQSAANFGAQANLNIGPGTLTLLQFDLTTLPAGASATQLARANLRLYVNRVTTPGQIDIALTNGTWNEAAATGLNAPATGKSIASGIAVGAAGSYLTVDVTRAVRAWLDGSSANQGVVLSASAARPASVAFDSKENTVTSHPAQLEVTLTGPQGPAGPAGPQGPEATVTMASVCGALNYGDMDSCLRVISEVKLVFVSKPRYTGNLGGLSGADAKCQAEANAAGLSGTFKAWLSEASASPATRFSKAGHYRLTDRARTLLAVSYAELISSGPRTPIVFLPNGEDLNGFAWTGTSATGSPTRNDCSNWTSAATESAQATVGVVGPIESYSPAAWWSEYSPQPCWFSLSLYCFQQ